MKSVIVVDDHAVLRRGIVALLEKAGIDVCGEAEAIGPLRTLLARQEPGALILDISLQKSCGLDILTEVKTAFPALPVLVFSMYPEEQYAVRALRAGARGYLCKLSAPELLVKAVRALLRNERFLTEKTANLLTDQVQAAPGTAAGHEGLSERELQIFLGIGQGKTLAELAREKFLSIKTVSTYRTRILKKTGLRNNADIIRYVIEKSLAPR